MLSLEPLRIPQYSGDIYPMNKKDLATACFKSGFNCSQSVLSTFSLDFGMQQTLAYRVASGFGGGMGRQGGTCGAVTGAFMVIGLKYGAAEAGDRAAREKSYGKVNEFAEKFSERNRSTLCKELLGVDISTPAGREVAHKEGRFDKLCSKYIADAAEILEEIL
jgi:C_GCAxxG_C_C family probable redox protein